MDMLAHERDEQGDYEAADALMSFSQGLYYAYNESEGNADDPNVERAYNIALAVYNHFNGTGSVNVTSVSSIEVEELARALNDLMADYMMSDDYYNFKVLHYAEEILEDASYAASGDDDQNLLSAYSLVSFILAQYTGTTGSYTVTWNNWDGSVLETDENVAADSTPSYDGTTPAKASDTYYDYTFSGWSDGSNTYAADALPAVSGDVTYTAQFTATAKTFKVFVTKLTGGTYTIENLTGETTVAQLKEIIADQIDIPATAQRLIFAGKTLEDAKTLAEYNIQKESTIHVVAKTYTVTWLNYDNSELGTTNVAYGAAPSYDGATPVRPQDANNTYTFAAWDDGTTTYVLGVDDLPPVTGDVTYTATFTAVPKVINYDGEHTLNPNDRITVSDEDEGKKKFDLKLNQYLNMQMLGIQKKSAIATQGGDDGIRFVTAVNSKLLQGSNIDDYGYIVVKAKEGTSVDDIYSKMDNLTYDKVANSPKNFFSCYGSDNTISGDFGKFSTNTDYKYVTLSLTNTSGSTDTVAARFYVKTKDNKFYYADYIDGNNQKHGGMAFTLPIESNSLV